MSDTLVAQPTLPFTDKDLSNSFTDFGLHNTKAVPMYNEFLGKYRRAKMDSNDNTTNRELNKISTNLQLIHKDLESIKDILSKSFQK